MKYLAILLILVSAQAWAFDWEQYIEQVKSEVNALFSEAKVKSEPKYEMPRLPKVEKDATSRTVYSKKGKVFQTGESFNKLSKEKKYNYRLAFLRDLVTSISDTEASDEELLVYLNILSQGGSREGIYRSIVLSNDYKHLELVQEPVTENVINFGIDYGATYLGLGFKQENIAKLNLWSIKRIIVEKTLELIDAFPRDGKNLYLWYGILSKQLAKDFPIWKSKLRKNQQVLNHIRWAEQVPFQHLKSEVIIKLNKVFNYLQIN